MPVCPHSLCPCGHKNVTAEALINHVQSSPWAGLYFCATCKCVCKSETVLIHHKQKVHHIGFATVPPQQAQAQSSSASIICRVCDRLYTSTTALQQHYRDTPAHPKCTRCNIGFLDNNAAQAHMASVHRPIPSAAFSCRICNRGYSSANELKEHYRDTPVHPKCTRCDIGFVDNAAIQAHVVSVHRPVTCSTCNGLQLYQEDVVQHYRISPKHPSCTVCDIGFENTEAFDEHTNTRHPAFRCRVCNLPFGSLTLLDAHYQESAKHPRCPECQLSFEDNLALIKHVIAIFNPLIKDAGRLILKTSQMSLHDALSDASMISRASRSSSVARSVRESSIGAITPARSLASPMSILQRQPSTTQYTRSPTVASDQDRGIPEGTPSGSPRDLASNISPASVISRASSIADHVIILDSFKDRGAFRRGSESTLPEFTASSQHSKAVSAAGSLTTRSVVAASETGSPVSSARSIFERAPSVASTSPALAAPTPLTFSGLLASVGLGDVSPTKESLVEVARSRASSIRSISTGDRTGSISPSSIKTVSPPPSHSVLPSPGQRERFRIAPVNSNNPSRAGSPPKSRDSSERTHSPGQGSLRQHSSTEQTAKAEPGLAEKLLTSPSPSPTLGAPYMSAQPQTDLALRERLVSYVYCRICRRDPCRQPAATMCGHVFCHKCISSEVVKTSRCPVCETPTLLYSIFKLHLV